MTDADDTAAGVDAGTGEYRQRSLADRLTFLNQQLHVDQTAHPITAVSVDGYEESSSITLHRAGARAIIFPGAAALLNPARVQAIVGAVIRRSVPLFTKKKLAVIVDVVWSLSTMRRIYDSVESATDWGRSYLLSATETRRVNDPALDAPHNAERRWEVFTELQQKAALAAANEESVPPRIVPYGAGGDRLVIRPWFHRFVQRELDHSVLSEQRIASLMGAAGWESLPTARSVLNARPPRELTTARGVQLRFYVVPEGWEPSLDDDDVSAPA